MDDLTRVADLGTALDHPSDLTALRDRTLRDLRRPRRRPVLRPNRTLLMGLAAAATAALVVTPSLLLADGEAPRNIQVNVPDPTVAPTDPIILRAQRLATNGASPRPPRGAQYLYTEWRTYQHDTPQTHMGSAPLKFSDTSRGWYSFDRKHADATQWAKERLRWRCLPPDAPWDEGEPFVTDPARPPAGCHVGKGHPLLDAEAVDPTDLDAVERWVAQRPEGAGNLREMMLFPFPNRYLPPRLGAALFLVMARQPGVRLVGKVRDRLGRPAVAVESPVDRGRKHQALFDPKTFAPLGTRSILTGGTFGPEGHVFWEGVLVEWAVVDRVGERPE